MPRHSIETVAVPDRSRRTEPQTTDSPFMRVRPAGAEPRSHSA